LVVLLSALLLCSSQAFAIPNVGNNNHLTPNYRTKQQLLTFKSPLDIPRGGADTTTSTELNMSPVQNILFPALTSGPYGVVALTALATVVVVPLTMYKQLYAISVGYGAAIMVIGLALQAAFQPTTVVGQAFVGALGFYGFRLAAYLQLREMTRKTPLEGERKSSPILKRIPLALSVSLFYAFLTYPALAALRNLPNLVPSSTEMVVTQSGIGMAIFGAVLEAVADLQKYLVKQSSKNTKNDEFHGPTGLSYRICRHPNYLGEILMWAGVFVGGVPSFGKSVIAWLSSVMGLIGTLFFCVWLMVLSSMLVFASFFVVVLLTQTDFGFNVWQLAGILSIMGNATTRLEERQKKKYGGQKKYKEWTEKVNSPLVPFF